MIDGSGIYSRQQWARILGVSPSAISQWLSGTTLPRAEVLAAIWEIAEAHAHRFCAADLEAFAAILDEPLEHRAVGSRLTVGAYMSGPAIAWIGETLTGLSGQRRRMLLPQVLSLLSFDPAPPPGWQAERARLRQGGDMVLAALAQPLAHAGAFASADWEMLLDYYASIRAIVARGADGRFQVRRELLSRSFPEAWLDFGVLDSAMTVLERYFPQSD